MEAKAGEANAGAAEEVLRLRAKMDEMAAQQKDWDEAWKNGKEALLRVHAQELQNQRVRMVPTLIFSLALSRVCRVCRVSRVSRVCLASRDSSLACFSFGRLPRWQ